MFDPVFESTTTECHAPAPPLTATVGSRAAAYIIDLLLLLLVWLLFVLLMVMRFPGQLPTLRMLGMLLAGWMFSEVLMFSVQEHLWKGRTIGKRFMGIRVTDITGAPPTAIQTLIRNLLRLFDNLPHGFTLGVLLVGLSETGRRLGDRAAGTRVIHDPTCTAKQPLLRIPADATAEERALLKQWFRSAPSLAPNARTRIADRMARWVDTRWPAHLDSDGDSGHRLSTAFCGSVGP